MDGINVFQCGTKVDTKIGKIQGMITCSSIRFDKVQYEITFNNDGKFETVWMNEEEFETIAIKQTIGFK